MIILLNPARFTNPNTPIRATFLFFYSLQFLAFDTEASHDILKVWDGRPENEMLLREVSGSLLPDGIHSTLNIVTIQFETDFYISKSGFAIDFSSKLLAFKRNPCSWICIHKFVFKPDTDVSMPSLVRPIHNRFWCWINFQCFVDQPVG